MKSKGSFLRLVCICVALAGCVFAGKVEIADGVDQALIGHWTFDHLDGGVLKDSAEVGLDADVRGGVSLEGGVFAAAGRLRGRPIIRIKANEVFTDLPTITISAWVNPNELSGRRVIFRTDNGDGRRILFSFQKSGMILSMGVNVETSGYKELDARIRPEMLACLQWHHVVGTFDGQNIRVYLDGLEIGSRRYPGRIILGGSDDAYIGSSGGKAEFFQGGIDDVRIFGIALTGDQIARMSEKGLSVLHDKTGGNQEQMKEIYEDKATFAETMAATRRNLHDTSMANILIRLVQARLAARFSDECNNFSKATNSGPYEYLTATDNSWNISKTEYLIDLLTEYKPLTDKQWARLSKSERKKWKKVDQFETKFQRLRDMGQAGTYKADWVNLMLDAGAQVAYRPFWNERVAPYVKPHTPPTRNYS
ncbi:MAG: hypothetical protein FVQ79_12565, partial [Planctomycetes bacterium]|nr:hypothetical protein [Planctomycetota bacterium]